LCYGISDEIVGFLSYNGTFTEVKIGDFPWTEETHLFDEEWNILCSEITRNQIRFLRETDEEILIDYLYDRKIKAYKKM